ncbi:MULTISPECIES: DNA gyrase inhibitor YacG [Methylomonas]|uniref:DNA gyrase inhibitor YacG n=1 Tax=Methylomonas TaxID=416 RepID=UPI001232D131|nr:DNA gyrase inhibitor YacG [Methylomonas rhizoryzae]
MSEQNLFFVSCPTCKKQVPWVAQQRYKPFCSQRCKLIDLGDWATEAHKIPGEPVEFSELNSSGQASE